MTAKPDLTRIWAATADPTDIVDPDVDVAGKFTLGWLAEQPPHTWFNYLQNFMTTGLAHLNEYGVAQWDAATSYPIGAWSRSTVDDKVYESLVALNVNNEPSVSITDWKVVGASFALQATVDAGTEAAEAIAPDTFKGNLDNRGLFDYCAQTFTWGFNDTQKSGMYWSTTPTNDKPPFGASNEWHMLYMKKSSTSGSQFGINADGIAAARNRAAGAWGDWKRLDNAPITGSNANGYYRIYPDGYIEQWGYDTTNLGINNETTISFPVSFVTLASVNFTATGETPAAIDGMTMNYRALTIADVIVNNGYGDGTVQGTMWKAQGY